MKYYYYTFNWNNSERVCGSWGCIKTNSGSFPFNDCMDSINKNRPADFICITFIYEVNEKQYNELEKLCKESKK